MAVIVSDSFNRANGSSLGNAETGQSWTVRNGTVVISNNRAKPTDTGGNNIAIINAGVSDCIVSAEFHLATGNTQNNWLEFRASDIGSRFYVELNINGLLRLSKHTGSVTVLGNKTVTFVNSAKLKAVLNGNNIKIYYDDVLHFDINDSYNATVKNHGFGFWANNVHMVDNFLIETLDTAPIGTDGTTTFDFRHSIYQDSSVVSDTKQFVYQNGISAADLRQILYSDEMTRADSRFTIFQDEAVSTDTRIAIYQDGATTQDTAQVLYEISSTAFDTLQELFNDGQVGATPFDIRVQLYGDASAQYDTKQAVYDGGLLRYDVAQVIYESNTTVADVKAVIYADSALKADALQSIYADGTFAADTLQRILSEFSDYGEVVRIVLEITQRRRDPLSIAQSHSDSLEIVQRKTIELNL